MSAVTEILTTDQIHDLWGCGYTILPRLRDPFELPKELIPRGMAYQWNDAPDKAGWSPVPYERHDGYFGPIGTIGDISISRLWLCERPAAEVDATKTAQVAAAHKLVDDWKGKFGGELSGGFKVGDEIATVGDANEAHKVLSGLARTCVESKTIETTTAIPKDMFPHMSAIFGERDRLAKLAVICLESGTGDSEVDAAVEAYRNEVENNQNLARWPALHALVLPLAVNNVRKSLKQETAS